MSPDDRVLVDVTCAHGECWTWGASGALRREDAEALMAHTRQTLPDARFAVRLIAEATPERSSER
jgi:hypothetical protein